MVDYEKKYKDAMGMAEEIIRYYKEHNRGDENSIEDLEGIFPELKESEDEKIRKELIAHCRNIRCVTEEGAEGIAKWIAWLEKQKDINSKEYVFRPLAGCDIESAAIQAVEQQKLGKKIVLAFNGAYIPVEEKTTDDIVNEYYSWLEKQSSSSVKWQKNTPENKPPKNHSVLMKTVDGIAEGEWDGKYWHQYRWSTHIYDSNVLYWIELHDLDEQGEQK